MEQLLDYKEKPQLERILEMLSHMDETTQRVLLCNGKRGCRREKEEESAETVSAEGAART